MAKEPAPAAGAARFWSRFWATRGANILALLLAGGLAIAVFANWDRWIAARDRQTTADATLQADLVSLSALVPAPVLRVAAEDFQPVKAGDLLVELDPSVYAARLAQAEANVVSVQASIGLVRAQQDLQAATIAGAEASLSGAQATRQRAQEEDQRQRSLLRTGIVGTEQAVEQADAALGVANAQVMQAAAGAEGTRRQLAVLKQQEAQLEAGLKAAEAMRDLARIDVGYTRITAPTSGFVGRRRVYPGQYVAVGTQVFTVSPLPHLYVIANYREVQVGRLALGQAATVTVDSFPGVVLRGHVASWSPGTGSEYALLPPDNATGNFTKVVQRVPVKVQLDDDAGLGDRLRAGMSVEVTIDMAAGDTRAGPAR